MTEEEVLGQLRYIIASNLASSTDETSREIYCFFKEHFTLVDKSEEVKRRALLEMPLLQFFNRKRFEETGQPTKYFLSRVRRWVRKTHNYPKAPIKVKDLKKIHMNSAGENTRKIILSILSHYRIEIED